MSNQLTSQQKINLTGLLDLNKNKTEIKQFDQFTLRNSPYYNDGISPLYKKESTGSVMDKFGNTYDYNNGWLRKNGVNLMEVGTEFTHIEEMENQPPSNAKCFNYDKNGGILYTLDDNTSYYKNNDVLITVAYGQSYNIYAIQYDENTDTFFICAEDEIPNRTIITGIFLNTDRFVFLCEATVPIKEVADIIGFPNNRDYFIIKNRQYYTGNASTYDLQYTPLYVIYKTSSSVYYSSNIAKLPDVSVNATQIISYGNEIQVYSSEHPYKKYIVTGYNTTYNYFIASNIYNIPDMGTFSVLSYNPYYVLISEPRSWKNVLQGKGIKQIYFDGNSEYGWNFKTPRLGDNQKYSIMFNKSSEGTVISGISTPSGYLPVPFLDVVTEIYKPIKILNGDFIYKSNYLNKWIKVTTNNTPVIKIINNRYISLNVYGYYHNSYDIKLDKKSFTNISYNDNIGISLGASYGSGDYNIASGYNVNYEGSDELVVSANFSTYPVTLPQANYTDENGYTVWADKTYLLLQTDTIPLYIDQIAIYFGEVGENIDFLKYYKKTSNTLSGYTYPVPTDNNILLPPSYNAEYYESGILSDYIKEGNTYFNLVYSDGNPIQLYTYGTGVKNASSSFVIQGQRFVIRNGVICSATIDNGLLTVGEGIINVNTMIYLGATPTTAYFYSPATHYIYQFTGDRNVTIAFESSEIEDVVTSYYDANSCTIYFASNNYLYCIYNTYDGNAYMYKKDLPGVTSIIGLNNGCFACRVGSTDWYIFSLYEREDFTKEPVNLKTHYYGVGDNRVSIIDTWYLRLFSEVAKDGNILLKVEAITDGIAKSETKKFHINKEDWVDGGYYYLRYQPQLQRGIGISLEIVSSDFNITDIQASYNPDTTIQLVRNKVLPNYSNSI